MGGPTPSDPSKRPSERSVMSRPAETRSPPSRGPEGAPAEVNSLVDLLRWRAGAHAERVACVWLADGDGDEQALSYGELDRAARAVAAWLAQQRLAPAARVLLLLPPGLDYAVSFLGCLYAGLVAVPAYPPTGSRGLPRLLSIVADAAPAAVLTAASLESTWERLGRERPATTTLPRLATDRLDRALAASWRPAAPGPQDLAFLQYTSGSTSEPKGVMVTHGNLLANQRMIAEAFRTDERTVVVSWLPLYHDMGLIGGLLHPLFLGARCILMSPLHFLQRPARWLAAVDRHRATVSGGPNFAYDLCARRLTEGDCAGLDLAAWRVAFNGAEPVRAETLDRFAAALAGAGFRATAFFPCYGLAEATLLVSGVRAAASPARLRLASEALAAGRVEPAAAGEAPAVRELVSSGQMPSGVTVRVVDAERGEPCPPGSVGELWVAGAGVAAGYWQREEATAEAFGARLAGEPGSYLRTGDLGILAGGELFVTGRRKDLILIRGRNLYPQDIEASVERSHPAMRPGGVAAFAVEAAGEERLVVVQEIDLRARAVPEEVALAARQAVAEEHEIELATLVLVKPGGVPKTTSGKVQRSACRQLFLAGELPAVGQFAGPLAAGPAQLAPRSAEEVLLARLWEEVLSLPAGSVGATDSFFALGGDSVRGSQLLARLEGIGLAVSLAELFAAPTLAALAARLATAAAPAAGPLPRQPRDRPLPLSSPQCRLWFLDQLDPGNPAYNLGVGVQLAGPLRLAPLAAAWRGLVCRHEALRSTIHVDAGAAVQVVAPAAPGGPAIPMVDLQGCPQALAAVLRQGSRRPFSLARGPLWRAAVARLGEDEHALLVAAHHIVSDGWSFGVLLRELMALYATNAAGAAAPLAALEIDYGDFAAWQQARLAEPHAVAQLAAWRARLAGAPPLVSLPADRPRPAQQSFRGGHRRHALPAPLVAGVAALAAAQDASPFMVYLAAFQALLYRLTGQRDLVVGSAVANRDRPELEAMVGLFVNTLPLRTQLAPDLDFLALLGRCRQGVLAALADREVPFERLVDELVPERNLAHTPLVQVMLVLQNAPLLVTPPPGLTAIAEEVDTGTARFDLALSLQPASDGLVAVTKYSRDLFDATTVDRWTGAFTRLLAAAVADPRLPLGELPLLAPGERQQLAAEWNDTAVAGLDAGLLLAPFEAQAARTPAAVALVAEGRILSYGELDRRANALAHRLRGLGVGPEVVVGVAAERSCELMVALYAVLKAGGAYLPLDPAYPAERLAIMLADGGALLGLTQAALVERLPAGRWLLLDDEAMPAEAAAPPASGLGPENLAYVLFTSGSTGRPKGVMVCHRAIVNRLAWMQAEYGLAAGEAVLQKTPISFDVSVWELFWPLRVGAKLVLARPGGHQDSAYLVELIRAEAVTTLHFVPSMLQVFLADPRAASCRGLRRLIASGEALPRDLVERAAALLPAELHNLYGPTEAAVDVTAWPCGRERAGDGRAVPIGRPISNLRLAVLDRAGRPVALGAAGHLHIAGVGLARGYRGRPGLTAERFVPDPLATPEGAGGRAYATGDLARLRPDGAIDFLGRLDHQVKLRGLRIELGEIEAALDAHPAVRESVVVLRDGRLVAYLVAAGAAPEVATLRSHLAARLPDYMLPAVFVNLPALPLSPSGKVDRRALPAPAEEGAGAVRSWVAPAGAVEERLALLWSAQLGVPAPGAEDDFFALGGDSIQGALLINRLQSELGAIVYVMALFDHPTIRRFAAFLTASYRPALAAAGWLAPALIAHPAADAAAAPRDDAADLAVLTAHLAGRFSPPSAAPAERNPPAVFLLSPFRSGSTLLRVMLAGHPGLFAPPELELLGFTTLGARAQAFAGRDSFGAEGLLRAVMELAGSTAEAAAAWVAAAVARDAPSQELYRQLQAMAAPRLLVDKTPRYALDRATLARAEAWFEAPLYVHLVRHPAATIHSYLEASFDEVYRFPLPARRQAEMVWRLAHANILDHLAGVPAERQHRLCFEELVRSPQRVIEHLCAFLGLDFAPAMLRPYEGRRMTDGLHAAGRMMGDPKFHRYGRIEAAVADRAASNVGELGAASWELAARLGYARAEATGGALAAIPRRGTDGEAGPPLSFGQQRLWFLDRLEPGSSAYNMPAAVHLGGNLAPAALARALAEIERRHAVLRATFGTVAGKPVQRLRPPGRPRLATVDLCGLAAGRREEVASGLLARGARRPFDLARGPLWRLSLLRLAAGEHQLLLNLHHIVCDGWSVALLTRELAALYAAFVAGAPSPLAPLPLDYADFAAWQRAHLAGPAYGELVAYWRRQLAGAPPLLQLPTDRPRPAVETHRGTRLPFRLPPALVAAARVLGSRHGATLFMVLLAALTALLRRLSGETDIAVGAPVAGRNRTEIEGLIGLFMNTLVLRTALPGDPPFADLLAAARQASLAAARHEELPFEKLVEELGVERSLGHAPLFVVMLALQNAPPARLALPGLALERLDLTTDSAKFDLTVDLAEQPDGGLAGSLELNLDLFDRTTIDRFGGQLAALLASAVARPAAPLAQLAALTAAERQQLVVEVNDSAAPLPAAGSVWEWVAATAARDPARQAVRAVGAELSYGALIAQATAWAAELARRGVGPEVAVAICSERTPAMLVAVLAVLAAGGAYVPLDPALPAARLAHMLADSGASLVLAERALAATLDAAGAELAARGGPPPAVAWLEAAPPPAPGPWRSPAHGESVAYVIYTSGSTGRPKGVSVRQRGVLNYLSTMAERPGMTADDVVMAVTTLSFDIAVSELLLPLVVGARIELVRREVVADPRELAAALTVAGATVMQATPTTFGLLLDGGWAGQPGLKVLCGGEPLPRSLADRLLPRVGELWNVYGPTETTVWSTAERLGATPEVSIGRPLANTTVHLAGRHGELAPLGAAGELLIGGEGLARGYHGRAGLAAERFVPDPWGAAGARLYRTGDLARRLADGRLEHLGRRDHQVKIRGFRLELGEIEAVLLAHPAVRQAVVVVHGTGSAARLVAYVVQEAGGDLAWDTLRTYLAETLPPPMVPSLALFLPALPLLPSGKVDRRGLPEPGHERPQLGAAFVSPQSEAERRIAAIWQQVLGVERVGVHDNFFDLGGHSLAAAEVHGRLREEMGSELPLLELFRHPTVQGLARRLQAAAGLDEPLAGQLGGLHERAREEREARERRRRALARRR